MPSRRPATASTRTRSSRTYTIRALSPPLMLRMRTLGVLWVDEANRMTAVGSPMGVIAAIIPVTNPTSTVLFKCLAAVKAGNAIVCAPHPRAARCCHRAAEVMADAAESAGAPRGLISCLEQVTLAGDARADAATATSRWCSPLAAPPWCARPIPSGKPTLAVGAGQCSRLHPSLRQGRRRGRAHGRSPLSPSTTERPASPSSRWCSTSRSPTRRSRPSRRNGTQFLSAAGAGETRHGALHRARRAAPRVRRPVRHHARPSAPASRPTARARCSAPRSTRSARKLRCRREILGPVLSFYRDARRRLRASRCREILDFGGAGHTLGLHAQIDEVIAHFSALPASRILINTPTLFGGMGFSAPPMHPSCWGRAPGADRSSPTMSRRFISSTSNASPTRCGRGGRSTNPTWAREAPCWRAASKTQRCRRSFSKEAAYRLRRPSDVAGGAAALRARSRHRDSGPYGRRRRATSPSTGIIFRRGRCATGWSLTLARRSPPCGALKRARGGRARDGCDCGGDRLSAGRRGGGSPSVPLRPREGWHRLSQRSSTKFPRPSRCSASATERSPMSAAARPASASSAAEGWYRCSDVARRRPLPRSHPGRRARHLHRGSRGEKAALAGRLPCGAPSRHRAHRHVNRAGRSAEPDGRPCISSAARC